MISQEESVRMRRRIAKRAIDLTMEGKWREAVEANKTLIENFADDVDAYNRLGRAYTELGEYKEAQKAYRQALALDPYNIIAKKNLARLAHASEESPRNGENFQRVEPNSFIEETGKAGVVGLYRLTGAPVLAGLAAGARVQLKVSGQNLVAENGRGEYVGLVEPRHAQRLVRLVNGGNRYSASIVSINESSVSVIIREEYQHPDQIGILSFPPKGFARIPSYVSERVRRELAEQIEEESAAGAYHLDEGDMSPQDTVGYGEREEEE